MKRIIPAICFTLFVTLPLVSAQSPTPSPDKLFGGADNAKVAAAATETTIYHIAKDSPAGAKIEEIDGMKTDNSSPVATEDAKKVLAALSAARTGNTAGNIAPSEQQAPAVIIRFKSASGIVDLYFNVGYSEMKVFRDGKLAVGHYDMAKLNQDGFSVAFIPLLKKAFPDDPDIKAIPAPLMSTADLVKAVEAAGAAYYDHYHANPASPENYVVTAALTGKTRDKQAFLDVSPSQVSPNGELLDEWGTPLRFVITQDENTPVEAWSAGKDKIFGNDDDVNKPKAENIPGSEGQ
ncbi:MAG TPA: hypothetical protein VG733_11155 [Chthoniobacteraceae bacterium]|nr:hypothetical protein [Chthoniobacteraceae bacterium]